MQDSTGQRTFGDVRVHPFVHWIPVPIVEIPQQEGVNRRDDDERDDCRAALATGDVEGRGRVGRCVHHQRLDRQTAAPTTLGLVISGVWDRAENNWVKPSYEYDSQIPIEGARTNPQYVLIGRPTTMKHRL